MRCFSSLLVWRPLRDANNISNHGTGTDTTAHALTCGTYFLTRDPTRLAELRKELVEAIPEVTSAPKCWAELERLPYLVRIVSTSPNIHADDA